MQQMDGSHNSVTVSFDMLYEHTQSCYACSCVFLRFMLFHIGNVLTVSSQVLNIVVEV